MKIKKIMENKKLLVLNKNVLRLFFLNLFNSLNISTKTFLLIELVDNTIR